MDQKLEQMERMIIYYLKASETMAPDMKNLKLFYENKAALLAYDVEERCRKLAAIQMVNDARKIMKLKAQLKELQRNLCSAYFDDANWSFLSRNGRCTPKGELIREALE